MTLAFDGIVTPTDAGSTIRGFVTAPVRAATIVGLTLALTIWTIVGVASSGTSGFIFAVVGTSVMAPAWIVIFRRNQQMALDNSDELKRLLEEIAGDGWRPDFSP